MIFDYLPENPPTAYNLFSITATPTFDRGVVIFGPGLHVCSLGSNISVVASDCVPSEPPTTYNFPKKLK